MSWRALVGAVVAAAAILLAAGTAAAHPLRGILDPSFGHNGRVLARLESALADTHVSDVARDSEGRLVLAGSISGAVGASEGMIQRRLSNGDLDTGFGEDGTVMVAEVRAVGVQANDDIVFAGRLPEKGCPAGELVWRLNADGQIDRSFGEEGCGVRVPMGVSRIAVLPNGNLLFAGSGPLNPCGHDCQGPGQLVLAMLDSSGNRDSAFGNEGAVMAGAEDSISDPGANGLVVRQDGTIVVAGNESVTGFSSSGALDGGFGENGVAKAPQQPRALLALPAGALAVAGSASPRCCHSSGDLVVSRLRADGSLDPGFGNRGSATLDIGEVDEASALAQGPEGSLVLAGGSSSAADCGAGSCTYTSILARFSADGKLDPEFGNGGWVAVEVAGEPSIREYVPPIVAISSVADGAIYAVGNRGSENDAFVLARDATGRPDPAFGTGGLVEITQTTPSTTAASGLAVAPDGGILASASSNAGAHAARDVLLRFAPGGRSGPIAGAGFAALGSSSSGALVGGRGGAYYLAGGGAQGEYVERLGDSGQADTRYGSDGVATLPRRFRATAAVPGRGGKLMVLGGVGGRMAVLQLTRRGTPDPTFGRHGWARVGFGRDSGALAKAAALDSAGRIVLAGLANGRAALARLRSDGRLDRGFGRGGRLVNVPASGAFTMDVAPLRGGGLLLATSTKPGTEGSVTTLASFGRRGAVRHRFGHDGAIRIAHAPLIALFGGRRQIALVVAAGRRRGGVAVHAYRPNGRVDRGFGRSGVATAPHSRRSRFRAVAAARQRNGRILVAGEGRAHGRPGAAAEVIRFR